MGSNRRVWKMPCKAEQCGQIGNTGGFNLSTEKGRQNAENACNALEHCEVDNSLGRTKLCKQRKCSSYTCDTDCLAVPCNYCKPVYVVDTFGTVFDKCIKA